MSPLDVFAHRVQVIAQPRLGVGGQLQSSAFGVHLGLLAGGILHQERAATHPLTRLVLLDGIRERMVHDLPGLVADRLGLNGGDVAVFAQPEIGEQVAEQIRSGRRHGVGREPHDEIRVADLPGVGRRELGRSRCVGRVALRRAGVDPFHDGRDLVVAQ